MENFFDDTRPYVPFAVRRAHLNEIELVGQKRLPLRRLVGAIAHDSALVGAVQTKKNTAMREMMQTLHQPPKTMFARGEVIPKNVVAEQRVSIFNEANPDRMRSTREFPNFDPPRKEVNTVADYILRRKRLGDTMDKVNAFL